VYQIEVDATSGQQVLPYDGAKIPPAALAADVTAVRLRATAPMPHPDLAKAALEGTDATMARKGERSVAGPDGARDVPVFDRDLLRPGNAIDGPALVDASDTTILVPAGAALHVDEYLGIRIDLETTTGGAK
jgi:N-methylhydantoinase A/oxoprolinase/acetone carboxylase beta subunit